MKTPKLIRSNSEARLKGKRNTSLAFFTSYERSLLKSTWGSQATRLSRDSFLPFASCRLCLQIARDPVACAVNGDMFCRECAVSNLIAQRKEIKRLEKDYERRKKEEEEVEREKGEEEKGRAVEEFERVMMGLANGSQKPANGTITAKEVLEVTKEGRGVKRKFELDEEEMLKNAQEERAKARTALDQEKVRFSCRYLFSRNTETDKNGSRPKTNCHRSGYHLSLHHQDLQQLPRLSDFIPCAPPLLLNHRTLFLLRNLYLSISRLRLLVKTPQLPKIQPFEYVQLATRG